MSPNQSLLSSLWERFKSWEGFLLVLLLVIMAMNSIQTSAYLSIGNQVNLFQLSIEKIIVALVMTFVIINGEIDLSVASMMGLSACTLGWLHEQGMPIEVGLLVGLAVGVLGGAFNGFWIAIVGLPSLVATLATMIMYRGLARVLLEDRSIGQFAEWFDALGQQPLVGPLPLAMLLFFAFVIVAVVLLQYSGFGRYVYVIGNNKDVARYSGVKVRRVKMLLFTASGTIAAIAGLLFAARLGSVRGDLANGFELDIITIVLLGGVSIFGGSGSIYGVLLSILIILNVRNGMSLANITGHVQTGVIGVLLILSVLLPNIVGQVREIANRRRRMRQVPDAASEA